MKTLLLTLSKKPFEVMVTGEKKNEYRRNSEWILSRLFNKDGTKRDYDRVKFVNGYGSDKPYFIAEFKGFSPVVPATHTYSNGLVVETNAGDWDIQLGDIVEVGNMDSRITKDQFFEIINFLKGDWLSERIKP